MSNVSYDARKVIEFLQGQYGVEVKVDQLFQLELAVHQFYSNHIIPILEQVTRTPEKAREQGWAYYDKPVNSLLGKRAVARRNPLPTNTSDGHYRMVANSLCVCDFNMNELQHMLVDIPTFDVNQLIAGIQACKAQGKRSVFYLLGVLKRERDTKKGLAIEARKQLESNEPWVPPVDFEPMDVTELLQSAQDFRSFQTSQEIAKRVNEKAS